MAKLAIPEFLDTPEAAWVQCVSHQYVANDEVACAVQRIGGEERLVLTPSRYFDEPRKRLSALVIALIDDGRLVDFPSGDRLAVPTEVVEIQNGSSVRS